MCLGVARQEIEKMRLGNLHSCSVLYVSGRFGVRLLLAIVLNTIYCQNHLIFIFVWKKNGNPAFPFFRLSYGKNQTTVKPNSCLDGNTNLSYEKIIFDANLSHGSS